MAKTADSGKGGIRTAKLIKPRQKNVCRKAKHHNNVNFNNVNQLTRLTYDQMKRVNNGGESNV